MPQTKTARRVFKPVAGPTAKGRPAKKNGKGTVLIPGLPDPAKGLTNRKPKPDPAPAVVWGAGTEYVITEDLFTRVANLRAWGVLEALVEWTRYVSLAQGVKGLVLTVRHEGGEGHAALAKKDGTVVKEDRGMKYWVAPGTILRADCFAHPKGWTFHTVPY